MAQKPELTGTDWLNSQERMVRDQRIARVARHPARIISLLMARRLEAKYGWEPFHEQDRVGRLGQSLKVRKVTTFPDDFPVEPGLGDQADLPALVTFVRAHGFDELPQIDAIASGDMRFVGVRPILPADRILMAGAIGTKKESEWYHDVYCAQPPGILSSFVLEKRELGEIDEVERYRLRHELDTSDTEMASPDYDRHLVHSAIKRLGASMIKARGLGRSDADESNEVLVG